MYHIRSRRVRVRTSVYVYYISISASAPQNNTDVFLPRTPQLRYNYVWHHPAEYNHVCIITRQDQRAAALPEPRRATGTPPARTPPGLGCHITA